MHSGRSGGPPRSVELDSDADQNREATLGRRLPFVGRAGEMASLAHLAGECARGRFAGVAILGEAGVGKTALLNRFARLQALKGAKVLSATAYDAESKLPFGVVTQWARDAMQGAGGADNGVIAPEEGLRRLFAGDPHEQSGVEDWDRFRFLEALRGQALSLCRDRLVLLIVDDAQFADAASLGFLHHMARRSPSAQIMVVAAVRTNGNDTNTTLSEWLPFERVLLQPLSEQHVAEMLKRIDGSDDQGPFDPDLIYQKTAGNPLLIASVVFGRQNADGAALPSGRHRIFPPPHTRPKSCWSSALGGAIGRWGTHSPDAGSADSGAESSGGRV